MSQVSVTVYGGVGATGEDRGEIGGNKILLETGERTWLLDFGLSFGKSGRFFDEFHQPRSSMGLRDHLRMGFIPIEGILRRN